MTVLWELVCSARLILHSIVFTDCMWFAGYVENFQNAFEDSDYSAGAIALSFYSGFWAYSGW